MPVMEYIGNSTQRAARRLAWSSLTLLFAVSLALQLVGIIPYDRGSWDLKGPLEELAWNWTDSQTVFYLKHPEPVVPPLIREITGRAPRLEGVEIGLLDGRPHLRFSMSEFARLVWKVTPRQGGGAEFSLPFLASKGENELVFEEDYFGENGPEAMERLALQLAEPCRHEFVVIDTLTGVEERHVIETSGVPSQGSGQGLEIPFFAEPVSPAASRRRL